MRVDDVHTEVKPTASVSMTIRQSQGPRTALVFSLKIEPGSVNSQFFPEIPSLPRPQLAFSPLSSFRIRMGQQTQTIDPPEPIEDGRVRGDQTGRPLVPTYPALGGEPGAAIWGAGRAEASLIEGLRRRESEAFSLVYERYKGPIYNYLYRLSGSAEIADDLTHDTFLSAYEALPTLRADSAVCAWLYRIASNRFRDLLRRKRIINWLSLGDRRDAESSLSESGGEESVPEQELVQAALRHLKPDYAICLTLRLAEGFNTEETASILKTSPEAIRMRLCRARQMFKAAYAAAERGEIS